MNTEEYFRRLRELNDRERKRKQFKENQETSNSDRDSFSFD